MTGTASAAAAREAHFDRVFAEAYEPLQRYLRRRCDPADVEDVLADALLVVWRRIDEVPTDAVVPWCYGVVRRCLSNHHRATSRARRLLTRLTRERTAADAAPPIDDTVLQRAMSVLSPPEREVIRLSAWEGLAPREMAVALGITPNAASIRLHRARQKLGAELRKERSTAGHEPVRRAQGG